MTVSFRAAVRSSALLIVGIAGASGAGKTLTALKIARGLAGGDDSKIAFVDTENGRAQHYAVAEGEKSDAQHFAFQHADIRAPFTPEAYEEAIMAADAAGFAVVVIDSFSHEWEGEGGLHDIHDDAVDEAVRKQQRMAEEKGWNFSEAMARDKASIGAWREGKRRHKRLVNKLLQCRAHLVICLRAEEKMRMEEVTDDRGRKKTVIVQPKDMAPQDRWVPICEKRLPYEMTLSFILTPAAPGVPIPIKLQEQHKHAVPLDRPVTEETGRLLAAWAAGRASPGDAESAREVDGGGDPGDNQPVAAPAVDVAALKRKASYNAGQGTAALKTWWEGLNAPEQHALKDAKADFKAMAEEADERKGAAA